MNPGSVFGSGFGQAQLPSPFGTVTGSASGTPAAFGTSVPFTSCGSSSQAFGSPVTANTGFGTVGGATTFGQTSGTDSRSAVFGNPGLGSGSGNVFGSTGPAASGFGSGTQAPAFGASTSVPSFGVGAMNQNASGSGGTGVPGFGASAFSTATTSVPSSNPGTGTQFGSAFSKGTSFSALNSTSSVTGGMSAGPVFGTGGNDFGGGTTAFRTSSSTVAPSGFAAITSSGFGTGSSGFGTGPSGFGTSTPGFGPVSTSMGTGASAFGITTTSGFGGGSSVFGSFTAAQSISAPLSSTQSSSVFGGSSVFGAKTGNVGLGFTSGSAVTLGNQAGSSVFGSNTPGVPPTSYAFGQIPASTAVVGSATKSYGFGANIGASSTGTTSAAFGTVDRATPFGVSTNTTGSVYGAQAISCFGAPQQAARDVSRNTSSTAGSLSSGVLPPPSYSASISSGQPGGGFASSTSTVSVFGGASRTTSGEGGVFGGASRTTSGEGGVFGTGAPRTTSGEGGVFGTGALRTTSGEGVFGGATRTTPGEGVFDTGAPRATSGEGVFGGAPRTTSGEGGVFGGAPRTTSGKGVFGTGAPRTTSGEGVFGGAPRTTSGEGVFGTGASRTTSGEGGAFGAGTTRTASGQGSVFGGVGRSVIKQESSQQQPHPPQMPPTADRVKQPLSSVFGGSSHTSGKLPDKKEANLTAATTRPSSSSSVFGGSSHTSGKLPDKKEANLTAATTRPSSSSSVFGGSSHTSGKLPDKKEANLTAATTRPSSSSSVFGGSSHTSGKLPDKREANLTAATTRPSSSSSVFGGRTNIASSFGGAQAQQGTAVKAEATSSVFGGRQSSEQRESLPKQPLFPSAAASSAAGSDQKTKQGSGFSSGKPDARSANALSIFGVKREAAPVGSIFGSHTQSGSVQSQKRSAASEEGTPERFKLRRPSSVQEDTSSKMSINCKGIPVKQNKGFILRELFSRFGTVKRVQPVPAKRYATIKFDSHEAAAEAKKNGTHLLGKGQVLSIFWKSSDSDKSPGASAEETAQSMFHFRRQQAAESRSTTAERVQPQRQLPSSLPSSVAAELASMSGADADIVGGGGGGGGAPQKVLPSAVQKRGGREGRSPQRREPAPRARDRTPPPSLSSSSSASSAAAVSGATSGGVSGLGKTTSAERVQPQRQLPSSLPSSVAAELASMSGADADIVGGGGGGGGAPQKVLPSAVQKRGGREGRSPQRREPAPRARDRTPPPSLSSSSSASSAAAVSGATSGGVSGLGKTTSVTAAGLRKMISTNTMEKVNVLDIRDKLMRQKVGRQSGGAVDSKAFVGTCPDMCPEKERLYREEVRRLSLYEIIPGSSTLTGSTSLVDHKKAVKEYSRSSADQDEPLPHELRPLPVLTMTMNYLLVEIANCGEDGKWAEWYDFLWNRTRGIRKEITQQQLCSQEVVDLLEKCVRFHIYCSERLCTEDMMVFDSKINDENLTKCLQTLKELYVDMENKHDRYCPNEAEFRAYIVLMNLNEGDTLREVQQLRPEVRDSPEISFAVRAYSALYSNNYVRFFRLVQGAPFLGACVLHRYFNQIRARALQVILRSHTARHKTSMFSLSELQRLLQFENTEEISEFCSYYGLRSDSTDLLLDRASYVEPESSIPSWRAVRLVESKRGSVSVGEVINGGPLQPVSLPTPECSFDEHGRFIGSLEGLADNQESQDRVKPFEVRAVPKAVQLQPSPLLQHAEGTVMTAAADTSTGALSVLSGQVAVSEESPAADVGKQELKFNNEVVKTVARDLFFEVIDQHAMEVAESVMHTQQIARQCEESIMANLVSSVVSHEARQVFAEVVEAEQVRQNHLQAAEKREREARVAGDVLVSVIQSAVEEQARDIVLEEIEEAEAREEEERRERSTLAVQLEVLQAVTREMVRGMADEVYQTDVVARLELLADLQKAVELRRTSQWLAIWRKALKTRERQKRAMLDFPCAPPMQSASQRLQSIYPDRPEHASSLVSSKAALLVNDRAQMTLLSPLESELRWRTLERHLSLASMVSGLQRQRAWEALKLTALLQAPISQAVQRWAPRFLSELSPLSVQWKLLLSLPGEMEEEDGEDEDSRTGSHPHGRLMPVLKRWLCAKFTHGDSGAASAKKNILSQYSVEVATNTAAPPKLRLGVCVRTVPEFGKGEKEQPSKEQGLALTKGTSAILFLLPHADTMDETLWLAARLRLARLLEAKPFVPAPPVAFLLPCPLDGGASACCGSTSVSDWVIARLGVQGFLLQGLVSDVAVLELAVREGQPPDVALAAPALQTQVVEAVKYLAARVPQPPDLRRERVGDVVENMVTQHFFTPVMQDLRGRLNLHKLHQAPNTLIDLYNSVLDHIGLVLTSPSLQDVSWPPPELKLSAAFREDWNSTKHLGDIYELVSSLRLPWFHYKDQASMEWSHVCHDVWTFVNAVVKKRCDSAVSLTSRISRVLAHTCMQFENLCSLTQNEDHCTPTYVNAPWTDLIVACAEFRLQRLHNWKEEEEDVGGDVEVLYEGEDLEEFEPPAAWIQALLDTEDTESQRVEDTVEQASILHFSSLPAEEEEEEEEETSMMDDSTSAHHTHISGGEDKDRKNRTTTTTSVVAARRNEQAPSPGGHGDLPDSVRSALQMSEKLLLHVGEERRKARAFECYLEKVLRGDASPDPSLDVSTIFPSPGAPRVVSMPAWTTATPATTALSAARPAANRGTLSTPRDPPRLRRGTWRGSLEPRRLTGEGDRMGLGLWREAEGDRGAQGERERDEEGGSLPLCEGVERFKESLRAQRYANELFEKRLQSLLES